ncbi:MAG TPA: aspartate--tRNA ligase, partial [Thermoanaerobaculia bacterium]|nr:aspartate--tRNA ligase [Thermoanaerobaculia bacterium]
MNRVYAGDLRRDDVGEHVTIFGWVQKQRDFGELVFVDLRDRTGIVQVVADQQFVPADVVAAAKELRPEFVVRIDGEVKERAESQKNAKLPTGDIEVVAKKIEVLNRADTPPFAIEDDTDASEELRLKHRVLDLRRPSLAKNFILRHNLTFAVRDYMNRNGFIEIETPILTKSTPEGARDYLVPSRIHHGMFYALPQSPQIFKQLLMVAGMDKYFQIVRCFRDEDLRADRQYEFTQIDLEMSFPQQDTIFGVIEPLIQ